MIRFCHYLLILSGPIVLSGVGLLAMGRPEGSVALIAGLTAFSVGLGVAPRFAPLRFTAWMLTLIAVAMLHPEVLLDVRVFGKKIDLQNAWFKLLMVQSVMFGMGAQMRLSDLAGVIRTPGRVGVGLVCQFTIMPLVGLGLALALQLPNEIAAGVVLIGCCSSGLASNVMVHLARGDLALSVTLTTVATLIAPVVTPTLMKLLAGQLVDVDFRQMMFNILKIVVLPIGAAMLHDALKTAGPIVRRMIYATGVLAVTWLAAMSAGGWEWLIARTGPQAESLLALWGFALGAVAVGVVYHHLVQAAPSVKEWLPVMSMVGILYFTAISTAAGRDHLVSVGWLLLIAAVLHNTCGYLLGYGLSRLIGMDAVGARTVALEVGMQNGAMGVGLADAMGKLATVGLAPILFSPWMNVSGSLLANYWRRRPPETSEPSALTTTVD